jgi:hypothetical protein
VGSGRSCQSPMAALSGRWSDPGAPKTPSSTPVPAVRLLSSARSSDSQIIHSCAGCGKLILGLGFGISGTQNASASIDSGGVRMSAD